MKFRFECRKCNKHFPCVKEFTGHNDVFPPDHVREWYLKQCVSPFHWPEWEMDAEFKQVRP